MIKYDHLKIEHLNAQSLLGNFNQIEAHILSRDIDVMCISESWLLPLTASRFIDIPGYSVYRCDAGMGGGVCVYVKENLKVNVLTPTLERPENIEDIWMTVQYENLPSFLIGCVYRHPHALNNSFTYLSDVFTSMCLRNKPLLVLGDFNDDQFLPNNKIEKITQSLHLTQMIKKPTRITSTSSTLIDLAITNRPNFVVHSDVLSCPVGDHELLTTTINVRKERKPPIIRTFRSLRNYSQNNLCDLLLNDTDALNYILCTDNVNDQVSIFTSIFMKCLNSCAPFVTKEIKRPYAPWIDDQIKEEIKIRNNLHKVFKLNRQDPIAESKYRKQKKKVKNMISISKTNYFKEQFLKCKGNIRGTWDVIKKIIPGNKKSFGLLGDSEAELKEKVEEFNKHFATIGENTFKKSQENPIDPNFLVNNQPSLHSNNLNKFRPQPVDINTLILIIKSLNATNSFGSDGIPLRFLIDSLPVTIYYILIIVNTSIVTGIHPDSWKHSYVAPVFKNGDTESIGNYRPISLLPILSKLLEKVIANQLIDFLESNKLLVENQHGFRPNLSTETALLTVTNKIYENIDNKKISLLLLLDLSKAFDSVNHQILIEKCEHLNIDSFWFENYLQNRVQSVRIGSAISSTQKIKFGVPQGSILGPLLFLIYINDLPKYIRDCLLVIYADDTQILLTGEIDKINELMQKAKEVLISAKAYYNKNGLLLNESKTQLIFFGSRQFISRIPENVSLRLGDVTLVPTQNVKNLGVHMDNFLTFNVHIEELQKKVTGTLLFINRVSDRFSVECRVMVVQSLVLSTLNYCLRVWGSTNKTQMDRASKILNFAAKVAAGGAKKYDHVTPIYNKLGWLRMGEKYIYEVCLLIFKTYNKLIPDWLFTLPTVVQVRGNRFNTRNLKSLYVPRTNTDIGARSLNVIGPKLWNELPQNIRCSQTISSFKSHLMKFLLKD